MTLSQSQQRKVEENLGLVGKVIKDKYTIRDETVSIATMICTRSAVLDYARRHTATGAGASPHMHTALSGMKYVRP